MTAADKYMIVITTYPDHSSAKESAAFLTAQGLVACVQLDDIQSFYMWEGQMESASEVRMTIKTRSDLYDKVEKAITTHHPYTTAQVVGLSLSAGSHSYFDWMNQVLRTKV
jgi:periplasmic divalent cation tolerance protein